MVQRDQNNTWEMGHCSRRRQHGTRVSNGAPAMGLNPLKAYTSSNKWLSELRYSASHPLT